MVNKHLNLGGPTDAQSSKPSLTCKINGVPKYVAWVSLRFPLNAV